MSLREKIIDCRSSKIQSQNKFVATTVAQGRDDGVLTYCGVEEDGSR